MKAIRITIYLPDETSRAERERITAALLCDRETLNGLRFALESETAVIAEERNRDHASRFRKIRAALTEEIT